MLPKQKEMDDIVRTIYQAIETKEQHRSTLFILCGDHGMNDVGNHGGSAPGETSPALVFMSPKFKAISQGLTSPINATRDYDFYVKVDQSDIAPTMAVLLGFPIPLNNLGVIIPKFLSFWRLGESMALGEHKSLQADITIKKKVFSCLEGMPYRCLTS